MDHCTCSTFICYDSIDLFIDTHTSAFKIYLHYRMNKLYICPLFTFEPLLKSIQNGRFKHCNTPWIFKYLQSLLHNIFCLWIFSKILFTTLVRTLCNCVEIIFKKITHWTEFWWKTHNYKVFFSSFALYSRETNW